MRKCLFTLLILIVCVPAISWAGGASDQKDRDELVKVLDDYGKFLSERDFESWGNLHSEDVIKMPPNAPATINRVDMVANTVQTGDFFDFTDFEVKIEEVAVYGRHGHTWGVYSLELRSRDGGPSVFVDGKFLTLYRKNGEGKWEITHDCFNSNVPPPAP